MQLHFAAVVPLIEDMQVCMLNRNLTLNLKSRQNGKYTFNEKILLFLQSCAHLAAGL